MCILDETQVFPVLPLEGGMASLPSVSTDQVAAFVELARHGSLRAAAETLHLTEQGVRNRLVALEQRCASSCTARAAGRAASTR